MSEKITVAEALVRCLEAEGIKKIFGYPGAAICPFYDKLVGSKIQHILVRHEANAGHAASGTARITGKPAVCVATSGPGATNLITAIATAYMDSIPVVIITGQVSSEQIGRDVFQEADITGAAQPFVKHSYLIKDANLVPEIVKKAFYIAGSGRPGPVLIDVPYDVQLQTIDFEYPESVELCSYKPKYEGNKLQIKRVAEAIKEAKKPLICAGGGLFSAKAGEIMRKIAETANIPVICTMMGISIIPTDHPLFMGMIGMHGRIAPNKAISECDLLILLGARVGDRAVTAIKNREDLKVIHIDIDPAEIGKNLPVSIPVVGDLRTVLTQLSEIIGTQENADWVKYLHELKNNDKRQNFISDESTNGVNPAVFIEKLNKLLPDECVISADVGQNQIWTANSIRLRGANSPSEENVSVGGRFITSGGMGTMGYSVPAAIGAKSARPEAEVIAICGDGSFQMQSMELATMVQHDINVKIIIMTNNRLGMVREVQTNNYENRLTAVFLDGSPDFIKLAEAYGIKGGYVNDEAEADTALENMLKSDKPYILQVKVDENERSIL
ncbi:MAG: biosynthetic-type acetolactate synthase large subunit [Oscillospiraceae bacterium]|nr:biosynthetic-type acetolactate synthase large subunit [Oscillospiraceae bacterium]